MAFACPEEENPTSRHRPTTTAPLTLTLPLGPYRQLPLITIATTTPNTLTTTTSSHYSSSPPITIHTASGHTLIPVPLPLPPTIPPHTYPPLPMFATFAMLHPYPVWKLFRGDVPERGPLRSGSYCGAALHRWYLMVPASAQLGARPERKDGVHPTLCNAPPP